jgi:hypothetical protein
MEVRSSNLLCDFIQSNIPIDRLPLADCFHSLVNHLVIVVIEDVDLRWVAGVERVAVLFEPFDALDHLINRQFVLILAAVTI